MGWDRIAQLAAVLVLQRVCWGERAGVEVENKKVRAVAASGARQAAAEEFRSGQPAICFVGCYQLLACMIAS